jgi:hypothetical protein
MSVSAGADFFDVIVTIVFKLFGRTISHNLHWEHDWLTVLFVCGAITGLALFLKRWRRKSTDDPKDRS